MYKATIEIDDPVLLKVLKPEGEARKDRSSTTISGNKIMISAKDITAFKATLNGLIKLIETYEKTSSAIT